MIDRLPDSEDWDALVSGVRRGECVVMLGPDAVSVDDGGGPTPVMVALGRYLKRRLDDEGYPGPASDRVSAIAAAALAFGDRSLLTEWVAEFYDRYPIVGETLDRLARLPVGLVVNAIPGLPVERAFDDRVSIGFYDVNSPRPSSLPVWSADVPFVYHLYGSLDEPSSLVLSDGDEVDHMISVVREDPPLPANLVSALRDNTLLYLGFETGLERTQGLLHVLMRPAGPSRPSFAVEDLTDHDALAYLTRFHRIRFFDVPPAEFVSELLLRTDSDSPSLVPDAPETPMVFICHASDDKAYAEKLGVMLRANGLDVWLDKEMMRGGEAWDRAIERTIRSEIGYFVVLQSRNLSKVREQESYLNVEIEVALDRQKGFPPDRVFVIPVSIDDSNDQDPDLNRLQALDLTADDGMNTLVTIIKRDIQVGKLL